MALTSQHYITVVKGRMLNLYIRDPPDPGVVSGTKNVDPEIFEMNLKK